MYPSIFLWAGYPLESLINRLWTHMKAASARAALKKVVYRAPHEELEMMSMLERCNNFHQTGHVKVVCKFPMDIAQCGLSIVHDGNASFNEEAVSLTNKDPELKKAYPVMRLKVYVRTDNKSFSFSLGSRTCQEYTYGYVHYRVSHVHFAPASYC